MHLLLQTKENEGLLHGCIVARGAPSISHMFFGDDYFVYFRANTSEASIMKQILLDYDAASRQLINFQKSSISFSLNVAMEHQELIGLMLRVNSTTDHENYLGFPSLIDSVG